MKYKPVYNYLTAVQVLDPYIAIHQLKLTPLKIHFAGGDSLLNKKLFETSLTYTIPDSISLDSILEIEPVTVQENSMLRIVTRDLYAVYLTGVPGRMIRIKFCPEEVRYNIFLLLYWKVRYDFKPLSNFVRHLPQSNIPVE